MSRNGEKTEQASQRKLEKAREDGKVVSSRYLAIAVQFIAGFLYFSGAGEQAGPALRHWRTWLDSSFDAALQGERMLAPSMHWTKEALSLQGCIE